jgi:thiol-disulfide isomerase/thioredoxin
VTGLVVLLAVLAACTVGGLLWRARNGLLRPAATPTEFGREMVPAQVWSGLGVDPAQAPVTVVQFSTAFCQPCRATRQVIGEVVRMLPEVRHVEVDAESHLDAVRALGVLRTPTVFVVDRDGRMVQRASGQPRRADVIAAVAPFVG